MSSEFGSMLELMGRPVLLGGLLIAMAVAAATLAVASLVRRDRASYGPTSRRLCQALNLSGAEARLLRRVARSVRAPAAGSLLVSRGYFDEAVGAYAASPDVARRLEAIRRKVFD